MPPERRAKGGVFAERSGELLRLLVRFGDLSANGDNIRTRLAGSRATAFVPGRRPLSYPPWPPHPLARLGQCPTRRSPARTLSLVGAHPQPTTINTTWKRQLPIAMR